MRPRKGHPQKPHNVFLDTNIFVSAVLSDRGGSFRILQEATLRHITIFTSSYIMQEIRETLSEKYPHTLYYAYTLLSQVPLSFIKDPTVKQLATFTPLIEDPKDAPILAGAAKAKVQFLITLDRKHFFTPKLAAANLSFQIITPADFLQKYL